MKKLCYLGLYISVLVLGTTSALASNVTEIESAIKEVLFDPYSAKIKNIKIIENHACATVNAKNRFGGYVGTKSVFVAKLDGKWHHIHSYDVSLNECVTIIKRLKKQEAEKKAQEAKERAEEQARLKAEEKQQAKEEAEDRARLKAEEQQRAKETEAAQRRAAEENRKAAVAQAKAALVAEPQPVTAASDKQSNPSLPSRSTIECAGWLGAYVAADSTVAYKAENPDEDEIGFFGKIQMRKKMESHPMTTLIQSLASKGGGGALFNETLEKSIKPEVAKMQLHFAGDHPSKKKWQLTSMMMPQLKERAESVCTQAGESGIRFVKISKDLAPQAGDTTTSQGLLVPAQNRTNKEKNGM